MRHEGGVKRSVGVDRIEQWIKEYEQLTAQIIHWDSLSLRKDQFFLAVEGLFIIAAGQLLRPHLADLCPLPTHVIILITVMAIFNCFLCWVWFKTVRRNREWLDVRLKRAEEIENKNDIEFRILRRQDSEFKEYGGHEAHKLVLKVPIAFALLWILLLFVAFLWGNIKTMSENVLIVIVSVSIGGVIGFFSAVGVERLRRYRAEKDRGD